MKTRNQTIDILRFFSVFYIAGFTHLLAYAGIMVSGFHPAFGYSIKIMMVSLVFISGYLGGGKSFVGSHSTLSYYKKKVFNAYLPFVVSSILSFAVYLIADKWLFQDMRCFFLSLFGISSIITPAPTTLWFILMMLLFYAITPILLYKRSITRIVVKAIVIYSVLLVLHYFINLVDDRVIMYYPTYVLGLVISGYKPNRTQNFVLLIISLISTSISAFIVAGSTDNIHILSFTLPFSIPILIAICEFVTKIPVIKTVTAYLGSISMSVYLFHRHVYILLKHIIGGSFTITFCYLFALPLCIAVSIVMDYLIKHLIRRE